jgi:hypothetical protein
MKSNEIIQKKIKAMEKTILEMLSPYPIQKPLPEQITKDVRILQAKIDILEWTLND